MTEQEPGVGWRVVALIAAAAAFMENLDGTVIATALPAMAKSFGVTPTDMNIGMSAYLLTVAVFIPISGWVADRFGARSVFFTALAVFTASSVLCGLSQGLWSFTAARVVQGIGGALMLPVGRLVVLRSTAKRDLINAIAYITWPGLAAPVLGPPVGGLITTYADWRWIFFLNVPLGLAGLVLIRLFIAQWRSAERRRFDLLGFALSGVGLVSVLLGLELVTGGHDQRWALPLMGLGAVMGVFWVRHAWTHPAPLMRLTALRIRTFAVTIWGGSLFRMAIGMVPFLLPLMFQVGFGMDAFTSGLLVFGVFAGNLGMKPVTTPILRRFGFRRVLVVNGLVCAVLIAACALFSADAAKWWMLAILFMGGLARSMQFSAINTLAFADVPKDETSGANAFFSMMQQVSMGMGIAVGAILIRAVTVVLGHAGPDADDFRVVFLITALLPVLAVLDFRRIPADAGAEVSGNRR